MQFEEDDQVVQLTAKGQESEYASDESEEEENLDESMTQSYSDGEVQFNASQDTVSEEIDQQNINDNRATQDKEVAPRMSDVD